MHVYGGFEKSVKVQKRIKKQKLGFVHLVYFNVFILSYKPWLAKQSTVTDHT